METSFFKMDPVHDKKEFLRRAWISLAQEDPPIDVFESDFGEVTRDDYHILCTGADYKLSWSGEIGDHRTESYVDFETYYEGGEKKQRQVKKERQVTDWHFSRGELSGHAKSWECIDARGTLNEIRYNFNERRYNADIKSDDFVAMTADELAEATDMEITDDMLSRANELCMHDVENQLRRALPGNEARSVNYDVYSYTPTYATLFRLPEYSAVIIYKRDAYTKRAYACEKMTMENAAIPNPISVEEEKKKLFRERDDIIDNERNKSKQAARKKASPIYMIGIGLFVLSLLIGSFLPPFLSLVIAIGALIFTIIRVRKINKEANDKLNSIIDELTNKYQTQIDNYNSERMDKIFNALNKKLVALGFAPASKDEFYHV